MSDPNLYEKPRPKYQHLDLLREHVKNGLVVTQKHPTFDYHIYNYAQTVQYEKAWDEVTLDTRGLILDGQGHVIARPFRKFFNIEEHSLSELPLHLPYKVYEKLDGSLGIVYEGEDRELYIATRGSFTSEQATAALSMFRTSEYDSVRLLMHSVTDDGYTPLFEIIYRENRIVVHYDDDRLVFLGAIKKEDGLFFPPERFTLKTPYLYLPELFDVDTIESLKETDRENFEGYVVLFENGLRVKVKLDEYVRLHRLLTGVSNVSVWNSLKNGDNIESLLTNVPDEFYKWIGDIINTLRGEYSAIEQEALRIYEQWKGYERAWIAKKLLHEGSREEKRVAHVVFAMLDGKKYDQIIWKMIRPEYQKPFYQQETEDV